MPLTTLELWRTAVAEVSYCENRLAYDDLPRDRADWLDCRIKGILWVLAVEASGDTFPGSDAIDALRADIGYDGYFGNLRHPEIATRMLRRRAIGRAKAARRATLPSPVSA